jgi:hypothetical protein
VALTPIGCADGAYCAVIAYCDSTSSAQAVVSSLILSVPFSRPLSRRLPGTSSTVAA